MCHFHQLQLAEDADRAKRDLEAELKEKSERIVVLRDLVEAWKSQAETLKEQCDNKLKRQEREVAAAQQTTAALREELGNYKAATGGMITNANRDAGQERKYVRLKEEHRRLIEKEKKLRAQVSGSRQQRLNSPPSGCAMFRPFLT